MGIQVANGSCAGKGNSQLFPAVLASPQRRVERLQNEQEQVAHLERLCGQQALELDLIRPEVDLLKKPGISSHPYRDTL